MNMFIIMDIIDEK